MGVRDDTLAAIRAGVTPGLFSRLRGVSLRTTIQYLNQMVGEGKIRRSDILFSIPRESRQAIAAAGGQQPPNVDPDDFYVVQQYGDAGQALGDMYDELRSIEIVLHKYIRVRLQTALDTNESDWWRVGVPLEIRKSCQCRHEEDTEPAEHPYAYTDLIDLASIIDRNWGLFQPSLPECYASSKKQLLTDLRRLNGIRRMVMHPVRGGIPTDDEFEFVRTVKGNLTEALLLEIVLLLKTSPEPPPDEA